MIALATGSRAPVAYGGKPSCSAGLATQTKSACADLKKIKGFETRTGVFGLCSCCFNRPFEVKLTISQSKIQNPKSYHSGSLSNTSRAAAQ